MKNRIVAGVAALLLSGTGTSFATHPLVSDDAGTLGKGTIQVELNGDIGTDKQTLEGQTKKTTSSQVASTVGIGVNEKIDVTFGYTHPWCTGDVDGNSFRDAGSSDFSLSMKWQIYEHEGLSIAAKPQLGYSYAVGMPETFYTMSYGTALILSRELEPFAFHLNIGYTYNDHNSVAERDESRSSVWNFSVATTCDIIKERLKAAVDFGTTTNQVRAISELSVFGLAGLIYSVNKNIDVSAGIKVGLTEPETDINGTFGVTLRF